MNPALVIAAATMVFALWCAVPALAEDAFAGRPCAQPVPQRSYDAHALTYGLAVDLTNCAWWDGSPIELQASLERVDPAGGEAADSLALCKAPITDTSDDTADPTPKSGACDVAVSVEHPAVEATHYHGEITFPWNGGKRTVTFNALCSPAGGCVDLPVNAAATLAPVGDLVGGVPGESLGA
jgi:hypothetical protein